MVIPARAIPQREEHAEERTVVLVGTAPLPTSAGLGASVLTVELELFPSDGEVVNVFCSMPSQLLESVLRRSLIGRSLRETAMIQRDVRRSYRAPAADAVCTALARASAMLPGYTWHRAGSSPRADDRDVWGAA